MFFETTLTQERIARETALGHWPGRLINDYLDDALAKHPDADAIVDVRSRYTWSDLREIVDRAALALLALGVRRGDVVTVQLPNWNEFVIAALALERMGGVVNPVAPIFRERELSSILRLARPVAAIFPASFRGFAYPPMYAALASHAPDLHTTIVVGEGDPGRGKSWTTFLGGAKMDDRRLLDFLRPGPHDVVELMFTSGTTGEPKGVMHTPSTLDSGTRPVIQVLGMKPGTVCHMGSTLGHQTGFLYGMHLAIHLGGKAVYQEVWEPETFLDLVEKERINFTMGATPFLADVLAAKSLDRRDTSSLEIFLCGGAPIPRSLAEEAGRRLTTRLSPGWGMSELGLVTTVYRDQPTAKITESDGYPYPRYEIAVLGSDKKPMPPGVEGDLVARSPAAFAGYVQGRTMTETFFDDGWFWTGDRARLDEEGYVRITGRSKDLIIRGGENVPVKEVEDVLIRHPKVRVVAVVAVPHARLGEIGCACVVPDGSHPTLAELCQHLKAEKVTPQFWPEQILVLDAFPMTPSGKIQKYRLRELAIAASEAK